MVALVFALLAQAAVGLLGNPRRLHAGRPKAGRVAAAAISSPEEASGFFPRNDALDKTIIKLALPAVANFIILPLVGTVDTFYIGRLGNTAALAALGAANQVFSSVFFVVSFLPSVITPLVAAAHAAGDEELLRRRVQDALFLSVIIGSVACISLASNPAAALRLVLPASSSPATAALAAQYLGTRAFTLVPAMLAFVGFATFRGLLDVVTPLRVSFVTQMVNVVFDPILIFGLKLGVRGAALATCLSEITSALIYASLLSRRGIVRWSANVFAFKPPSMRSLAPLLTGGAGVLSRSVAMNAAFLSVTRATQAIDPSGAAAAAHTIAMQTWQLGGVVLFALSAVASILVPSKLNAAVADGGGKRAAKRVADRMLGWGFVAGIALATCQLAALPLLDAFTPVASIRAAARAPAIIGAVLQLINGVTFVGEGVMQGHQAFFPLAINSFFASGALITSLHFFGTSLTGVWLSFGVFNFIRLVGAMRHHLITGPIAPHKLKDLPF